MKAICCDTATCEPLPWFPKAGRAYECKRCGRVWTYLVTKGKFSDWRRYELTRPARPADRSTGTEEAG